MKRRVALLLLVALIQSLVTFTAAVNALPREGERERENRGELDPVYGRIDPFRYGFDSVDPLSTHIRIDTDEIDSFGASLEIRDAKARLLNPEVFDRLSSAGKRAALLMNGRLHGRRPSVPALARVEPATSGSTGSDNIRVNNPAVDEDGHTQSETSIAVNGSNVVISFNDAAESGSGYAFSTDGGTTFTHKRIPTLEHSFNLGDGVVAYGPSGELYYSTLAITELDKSDFGKSIVGVAKSTDNGATFTLPVDASTTAGNEDDFQDKEWIAVDRGAGSRFRGNVYVCWTDFSHQLSILCARSTDGGKSFQAPVAVREGVVQGSMAAIARNGDLYIAYSDFASNPQVISVARSTDGGATFSVPKTAARVQQVTQVTGVSNVRANSFASIVVDDTDTVHIVYDSRSEFLGPDRSDVYYVRSVDGGSTFSEPSKLNDDGTLTTQLLPSIAAAGGGRLAVKWWDRRNDPLNDSLTDVYMCISNDGGASFGKNFRVTDHNWAFGPSEFGSYHGDYDDIAAQDDDFLVCWSDERGSDPDVYFAKVRGDRDPAAADFNISAVKLHQNVTAGGSINVELRTGGVNGFAGEIALAASPEIPGLAYRFASTTVSSSGTATLTLSTSSDIRPGTYLITVAATSAGITRRTNTWLSVFDSSFPAIAGPSNVSRTRGYTFQSAPQVDSNGTIHMAFYDDSEEGVYGIGVYYTQSTDGGQSYSTPLKLSVGGGQSYFPLVKVDPAGIVHVLWRYQKVELLNNRVTAGRLTVFYSRSTDGGKTFSPPSDLASTATSILIMPISAEIGSAGDLMVFYLDGNVVRMIRSTDGGATFSAPSAVTSGKQSPFLARTAVSGNAVALLFADISTRGAPLFVTRSTDRGATFSRPVQVSQSSDFLFVESPAIALDSAGTIYVAYTSWKAETHGSTTDLSDPATRVVVSQDGKDFSPPRTISVDTPFSSPDLLVGADDTAYLLFNKVVPPEGTTLSNTDILLSRSRDRGSSFSPPVSVSHTPANSFLSAAALAGSGNLNVVWTESPNRLTADIFLTRSSDGGVTFGLPLNVSNNQGVSREPFINTVGSNLLLTWTDDSAANLDVFSALLPQGLVSATPDFALVAGEPQKIRAGKKGNVGVNISRTGGFQGGVTVTAPDLPPGEILRSESQQSTTGTSVSFDIKAKRRAVGQYQLVFTGRDASGRVRTATATLEVTQ